MAVSGFRLLVRQGPRAGQTFDLNKPVILIGREAGNEIILEDPQVSRHHARLTQQGGGYIVEDMGSTNGTFINGRRVLGATPLNFGDALGLGDTIVLEVQSSAGEMYAGYGQPQPAMAPPPAPAPAYGAPPPAYGAPPPPVEKQGISGWMWGCGCLIALVVFAAVAGVLAFFLAPPEVAGPACDALRQIGLGMLCQ